jgi:ABC-type dipeptide/oligopeptide/nickel transport system permease subunit
MREAPSAAHWFGTDEVGRDLLTRVLYGGQLSLLVGFSSVLLGTTAGGVTGIVSGYFAGRVDMVIQRVMDALMAFPALILAMALMAVVGGSTPMTIAVIALILVPSTNRVVRSATLSVKERTFVEAARAIGAGSTRILAQHVLPNVTAPIIVIASVQLGGAILVQASLSFLGLGPSPPTPTWGGMLSGPGRAYMEESPWLAIFPGLAIAVAVLGFNLLGDGVRDVLDPRLRER